LKTSQTIGDVQLCYNFDSRCDEFYHIGAIIFARKHPIEQLELSQTLMKL